MKKLILALSALLLAVSANAQLGIVAGVTSTKTNLDEAYKDIAETMDISEEACKKRIQRTKKRVQKILSEKN